MKTITLTRKELYDLVWSMPLTSLAKKYNITDAGIRKLCVLHRIPLPRMGHWQKVKVGKRVHVKELLSIENETPIHLDVLEEGDGIVAKNKSSSLDQKIDKEVKKRVVQQPKSLHDPLVTSSKKSLLKNFSDWRGEPTYAGSGNLDIKISKNAIDRAIEFMDSFLKALRGKGYGIVINYGESQVVVMNQHIQFALREKHKRILKPDKYGGNERWFEPTGILYMKIGPNYNFKEFIDGKLHLEEQLDAIISYIEEKAKRDYDRAVRHKEEERLRQIQLRKEKEFHELQIKEIGAFKNLMLDVQRWNKLKQLRKFIDEVESEHIAKNSLTDEVQQWLTWAKKKADWYDPTINAEDELLVNVDKNTLSLPVKSWF